jgi:4-hydroxy-3-methylbut-2-enyl diphosphate reductase
VVKIILIEPIGFCPGVRRAIEKAKKIKSKVQGSVYTDGPLIHNQQVLQSLKNEHIFEKKIDISFQPESRSAILIRAHGITPERRRWLNTLCHTHHCPLADATCPDVAHIAAIIRRYSRKGFHFLILGNPDHAEIMGLKGYAETPCLVLQDIPTLHHFLSQIETNPNATSLPYVLLSQSTLDVDFFEKAAQRLGKRLPQLIVHNTICPATRQRQLSLQQALKTGLDGLIVIGSKHSHNTQQLVTLAHKFPTAVWNIEHMGEINFSELHALGTLGICSGTSASEQNVQEIYLALRKNLPKSYAVRHHDEGTNLRPTISYSSGQISSSQNTPKA